MPAGRQCQAQETGAMMERPNVTQGTAMSCNALASVPGDALIRQQMLDELLATAREATARWYERQHETMAALSALMHALLMSRDPVRTAEVWMDWQDGALERLISDARDQRDISLALARCCGDGRLLDPPGIAAAGLQGDFSALRPDPESRNEADDR